MRPSLPLWILFLGVSILSIPVQSEEVSSAEEVASDVGVLREKTAEAEQILDKLKVFLREKPIYITKFKHGERLYNATYSEKRTGFRVMVGIKQPDTTLRKAVADELEYNAEFYVNEILESKAKGSSDVFTSIVTTKKNRGTLVVTATNAK